MKLIPIKSQAKLEMLERCAADPAEARRRGMTCGQAKASIEDHVTQNKTPAHRLPARLGPVRLNRHGARPLSRR